jgi:(2S)-methylsuccinyl-CoA dehydrogenase
MTAPAMANLEEDLVTIRRSIAAAVKADGPDAHQVEIDHLVWCHAHAEAARALADWALAVDNPVATEMAEIAAEYATGLASGVASSPVGLSRRLARLSGRLHGLEDVGASDEHRVLRSALRDLTEGEIVPLAARIHREDLDVPESIIRAVAEFGLFGMSIPGAYGGSQETQDTIAMLIATEELSRGSLAAAGSLSTRPEILVRALLRGGTEEQKRRWLPAIASGEKLVAVAVTEPDFGSDVAGITCRAARTSGSGWEINGTKLWCTFGGRAELLMLLARTGDGGHRGLSAFVLEKPAFAGHAFEHRQEKGGRLEGRAIPTIGYRGMHTFELSFDHYLAPVESLIGGDHWIDRGFYLQMEGFALGRIQTAGRAVGLMQAAVEDALTYAGERRVFGRPIDANELAQSKLGGMALRLQASRRLSYRAAEQLDRGAGQVDASVAKLYASRMAEKVTRDAAQMHGAMGYSEETDVSRYFVDARVLPVFEGAEEILSLRVIGRALLEDQA